MASIVACGNASSFTTEPGDGGGGPRASGGALGTGAQASTGGSSTGGAHSGGTSGSGGSNGGAGNSGAGGQGGIVGAGGGAGAPGSGGCGPCPAYACPPGAVTLFVNAPNGGVVGSLSADASSVGLSCTRNGCGFVCRSTAPSLPDGSYEIKLTAPGYSTAVVPFTIANPTDCGCCGCCPGSFQDTVTLQPDGSPITGCCSDLQSDPMNCGKCGHACPAGGSCSGGLCQPALGPCLGPADGFSSCNGYCASLGKSCVAACGATHNQSLNWWSTPGCSQNVVYSTGGACADAFYWASAQGYRCCCSGD